MTARTTPAGRFADLEGIIDSLQESRDDLIAATGSSLREIDRAVELLQSAREHYRLVAEHAA